MEFTFNICPDFHLGRTSNPVCATLTVWGLGSFSGVWCIPRVTTLLITFEEEVCLKLVSHIGLYIKVSVFALNFLTTISSNLWELCFFSTASYSSIILGTRSFRNKSNIFLIIWGVKFKGHTLWLCCYVIPWQMVVEKVRESEIIKLPFIIIINAFMRVEPWTFKALIQAPCLTTPVLGPHVSPPLSLGPHVSPPLH